MGARTLSTSRLHLDALRLSRVSIRGVGLVPARRYGTCPGMIGLARSVRDVAGLVRLARWPRPARCTEAAAARGTARPTTRKLPQRGGLSLRQVGYPTHPLYCGATEPGHFPPGVCDRRSGGTASCRAVLAEPPDSDHQAADSGNLGPMNGDTPGEQGPDEQPRRGTRDRGRHGSTKSGAGLGVMGSGGYGVRGYGVRGWGCGGG